MKYRELVLASFASILLWRLVKSRRSASASEKRIKLNTAPLPNGVNVTIRSYAASKQVVYISIEKKIYFAKDAGGQPVLWSHTFAESIAALPADEYFQLSRSCIVHRSIIAGVNADPLKHKLCVVLAAPFHVQAEIPVNRIIPFKIWWKLAELNPA